MSKVIIFVLLILSVSFNIYLFSRNSENLDIKGTERSEEIQKIERNDLKPRSTDINSSLANNNHEIKRSESDVNPIQHIIDMREKDYSIHSIEELGSLAKKGDLIAYHNLMIELAKVEEINESYMKNLAIDVYLNGSEPGGFLLMADLASSIFNDNTEAYSYFLVAENFGDELATAMADDYMYRYNLTKVEVEKATQKATDLISKVQDRKGLMN